MVQHAKQQLPDVMEVLRDYQRSLDEAANLAITLSCAIPAALEVAGENVRNDGTTLAGLDAIDAILASFGSITSARENLQIGIRHLSAMLRAQNKVPLARVKSPTPCPSV